VTSPAIDAVLVRALLAQQHPDLAELPVVHLADGWDNRIFRLGERLTVRLPRRAEGAALMAHEHRWLPRLVPGLPSGPDDLRTSAPIRLGLPGCGYPWRWSVGPLLPGRPATEAPLTDPLDAAVRLGRFLAAFHQPAPPDAPPNPVRGGPLSTRAPLLQAHLDAAERQGRSLGRKVEGARVGRAQLEARFAAALDAPAWSGPPLWLHGDPHPANLLVHEGRLSGVIDFGDLTSGDPATDLFVAWQLLPAAARGAFREAASSGRHPVDDAMWARGEGWAIAHCVAIIAGSPDEDAPLVRVARRTLSELS
jgi:aminoglycoside phosphotransferase (APT) family kinase protein